jgi:uncharacterized protein YbaR (Trm112 family)
MTSKDNPTDHEQRLVRGYNHMLERLKTAYDNLEHEARPVFGHLVDIAQQKAVEFGELSREEAERIGDYLKRDIEDVADYLAGPETKELADWFKFDISLIENRILELFASVADKTKLELMELEERARMAGKYHTGEITGIGSLVCEQCGQVVHFHATGHIPPCPRCHATLFTRPYERGHKS